ncbi:PIN domain-containing protein [Gaiella sp.]|uniref:PIN domain-containing protein n=1 Tax=Gaiella sp. TaxID=2663207 RepID=UPI002E33A985|nr:PIN domain-containing protein [Gaiella sp.]HEX5585663.1 PIN domain-containing protein [Gaiella sp.]
MGVVVDTSALVDLERAEAQHDLLDGLTGSMVMPAIVLAELLVGVRLASSRRRAVARQAQIDALRSRIPVVDFGVAVAERWATLLAALRSSGIVVPANDLCVAATALDLGWDVLVGQRDEAHFRRVPGLGVRPLVP